MRDEHVERIVTQTREVGVIRHFVRPPVDAVNAVAPVDRERAAEEPALQTSESDPGAARNVRHVIGQGDRSAALAMLGQREVVVVISVDEPELDAVTRARSIDGREEPRPVGMVREVAEVADLDHDRAVLLGRRADEPLDPRRVAVGVASHEHATNIVS